MLPCPHNAHLLAKKHVPCNSTFTFAVACPHNGVCLQGCMAGLVYLRTHCFDTVADVQEQYNADAETWSSEQAALQADLAALAAQTALKSLALDAMMRNSNRAAQGSHTIGGPLWQQVWLPPPL